MSSGIARCHSVIRQPSFLLVSTTRANDPLIARFSVPVKLWQ